MATNNKTMESFELVIQGFAKLGMEISTVPTAACQHPVECCFRNNPDGSIRWVWPSSAEQPDFLKFYYSGGFKSRLFAMVCKAMFSLRLGGCLASGKSTLYANDASLLTLTKVWADSWAVFTGTVGPNRKVLVWHSSGEDAGTFCKIAVGDNAFDLVNHEAEVLRGLSERSGRALKVPALLHQSHGMLMMEEVNMTTGKPVRQLEDLPFDAWDAWLKQDSDRKLLWRTACWVDIQNRYQQLLSIQDNRIPRNVVEKIGLLMENISPAKVIDVSFSHGDFTPWNVHTSNGQLQMIDWELSMKEAPALYDLFHFVYQSAILIGNNGAAQIRNTIDMYWRSEAGKKIAAGLYAPASLLEQLYLLHITTYYLNIYATQPQWHTQVQWLMNAWSEMLSYWIFKNEQRDARSLVLDDLQTALSNINYAVLKAPAGRLSKLSVYSDLDICINKKDAQRISRQLVTHPLVKKTEQKRFSFMQQSHLLLQDGSMIHADYLWQIKRKHLQFMDAEQILKNAEKNAFDVSVPTSAHDFAYTWLFHTLNGKALPGHHAQKLSSLPSRSLSELRHLLNEHYGLPIMNPIELTDYKKESMKVVEKSVRSSKANRGWSAVLNGMNYLADTVRRYLPQQGFVVTFSGVDGAGKSTIIAEVSHNLEKQYRRKVKVLRHRPSLLPIISAWRHGKEKAEQLSVAKLPRQGKNSSQLSSLLRFGYYYADYLMGQFYVQLRYVMQGYVVLYDRYYFDFINDSKRSNIILPASFTTNGYRFLLKPRFNFFLYAHVEEILKRKQELDATTIEQLTAKYKRLFEELGNRYHNSSYQPVLNIDKTTTVSHIFNQMAIAI